MKCALGGVPLILAVSLGVSAWAQSEIASEEIHHWCGQARVDMRLALDELRVEADTGLEAVIGDLRWELPGTESRRLGDRSAIVRLPANESRQTLQELADWIRAGGPRLSRPCTT